MLQAWFRKAKPVDPYTQLAPLYDDVMCHVDYRRWAAYLLKLFQKGDLEVNSVLDIACGTGSLLLELAEFGLDLAGFDSSLPMLLIAKRKTASVNLDISLWCASMFTSEIRREFDATVCTYDSINYCLNRSAYETTLRNTARALRPGGLFIFDVCTRKNSQANFQNYYESEELVGFRYIRQSYYSPEENIQTNEFVITRNSESACAFKEQHQQKIYRIADLREWVPSDLFSVIGTYDGFSLRSASEKSDRVHFVLKRL